MNFAKELAEINNDLDLCIKEKEDFKFNDRINEMLNELLKVTTVLKLIQLKKTLHDIVILKDESSSSIENLKSLLHWINMYMHSSYYILFSNIIDNHGPKEQGIFPYKKMTNNMIELIKIVNDTYLSLCLKNQDNDKLIFNYLNYLTECNNLKGIIDTLSKFTCPKYQLLYELYIDLIPLIIENDDQDISFNKAIVKVDNLLNKLNSDDCRNIVLTKDFMQMPIGHMFKIYFETNTKDYAIKIGKCVKKLLPYVNYTSPNCYLTLKKRLRVGFLSSHFHNYHSVFVCTHGNVLFDIENVDIFVFFLDQPKSEITKIFAQYVKNPVFIVQSNNDKTNVETVRDTVLSYKLDILVFPEIGENSLIYNVAHSRLAPLQITTIGHCDTSGLDTIDYYISSKYYEDEGSDKYYSEKLILMNDLIFYTKPTYINVAANENNYTGYIYDKKIFKTREELGFNKNDVILHCIQSDFKFSNKFVKTLKRIMEENNNVILLLKEFIYPNYSHLFKKLIDDNLPSDRIRFLGWNQHYDYYNYLYISDIVLMPFPFTGYCTVIDAIQYCKPIVTLIGKKLMGRMAHGMFEYINVKECSVTCIDDYVKKVGQMVNDTNYRMAIVEKIRKNGPNIFYNRSAVDNFYNCLKYLAQESAVERAKSKICYITSIYGNYEKSCKKFVEQNIESDFICFTDNPNIIANGWTIDTYPYHLNYPSAIDNGLHINSLRNNNHPFNIAKYYKQAFQNIPILKKYDTVIWLDGTIEITNESTSQFIVDNIDTCIAWSHEYRNGNLYEEVIASELCGRYTVEMLNGFKQPYQNVYKQYTNYLLDGYDEKLFKKICSDNDFGVWITCFIAFNNKSKIVSNFLNTWYLQTLKFTTQDQIGFPYSVQKTKMIPYTLPNNIVKGKPHEKTDFYIKHEHGK